MVNRLRVSQSASGFIQARESLKFVRSWIIITYQFWVVWIIESTPEQCRVGSGILNKYSICIVLWQFVLLFNVLHSFCILGRRYARWHLLKDKFIYLILFFVIIMWFEWMMHSQIFHIEVHKIIQNSKWKLRRHLIEIQCEEVTTRISSGPGQMWTQIRSPVRSPRQVWRRVRCCSMMTV